MSYLRMASCSRGAAWKSSWDFTRWTWSD